MLTNHSSNPSDVRFLHKNVLSSTLVTGPQSSTPRSPILTLDKTDISQDYRGEKIIDVLEADVSRMEHIVLNCEASKNVPGKQAEEL